MIAAIVAEQGLAPGVIGEGDAALAAGKGGAAIGADGRMGEAPAIQEEEGLPPSLMIGLLVTGVFISAEFAATLLGYALLGGYLGLRPSFIKNRM
jgi:hypothetical protein